MPIISTFHLKGIGGHKKRSSARIRQRRGFPGSHHRHESQAMKHQDYLTRKEAQSTAVGDVPVPLIDIGVDRIGELIRGITGENEDAYQDTWVKVLSNHCQSEQDILGYAKQSIRKAYVHNQWERSIQVPLALKKDSHGDAITMEDVLASPEPEEPTSDQYVATSSGKINKQGYVLLDRDVYLEIKKRFPHDPLNHAIRKLVMLPPPERDKIGWHKWEDELIKVRYPWGGSRAVMMDLNRTRGAIESRAKFLRVSAGKSINSYKPVAEWLNMPEVAEDLGCSWEVVNRLIKKGRIASIRVPRYHQGHDGVFVTPEALAEYKGTDEYRTYKQKQETLRQAISNFRLFGREHLLASIKELRSYPQSSKVALLGEKSHYVHLIDGGLVPFCDRSYISTPVEAIARFNFDPFTDDVPPTCKRCLRMTIKEVTQCLPFTTVK